METIDLHSDVDAAELASAQKLLDFMDTDDTGSINDHELNNATSEQDDAEALEMLKGMVKRWMTLDKDTRELNEKLKSIKDEKKQFEDKILDFMNKTDQDEILVKNGKISKKEKESKETINEEYIKKCLVQTLTDMETVNTITKLIVDGRLTKKTQALEKSDGASKKNKPKN